VFVRVLIPLAVVAVFFASDAATRTIGSTGCEVAAFQNERQDSFTIERLETGWSVAFLQGDPQFEQCLLLPVYREILRSGKMEDLSYELDLAAKNRGKHRSTSGLPKVSVLIHDNVAVAYGLSGGSSSSPTVHRVRFADYYIWEGKSWHAFFSQQTTVE
jgi:hypothetical protein